MLPRLLVSILALLSPAWALAAPSHVRIVQQDGAYTMLVDGQPFRVKGAGVARQGVTGDLIVSVDVAVPQKLSAEAKSALEAFAAAQTADPREAITRALRSRDGARSAS